MYCNWIFIVFKNNKVFFGDIKCFMVIEMVVVICVRDGRVYCLWWGLGKWKCFDWVGVFNGCVYMLKFIKFSIWNRLYRIFFKWLGCFFI